MRPTDPRPAFPSRESPSVRRVMFLDYDWIDLVDLRVRGFARDEITDASGATRVEHDASVDVETGGGLLTKLELDPVELDVSDLLGQPLRQGFRARVRAMHDGGGRPLGLLLDDLPGAMIAAGYVHAMERSIGPGTTLSDVDHDEMPRSFQQADLCSGWRSDGTMMIAVYAGEPLPFEPIAEVPQVPEDAGGWPDVAIPVPGLRRYRRIDVVPDGSGVAHRRLVPRHVSELRRRVRRVARVHGASPSPTPSITHCSRSVPFPTHCRGRSAPPLARWCASSSGAHLEGLRSSVPKVLQGIESCTHLTNELRELADVPYLAASLANA